MGAWGFDSFENDEACDWIANLEEASDLTPVEETLDAVLKNEDGYLDSYFGSNAIAACEVLARLKGPGGQRDAYTERLDRWVESHPLQPDAALIGKAHAALEIVLGKDSELRELWEESDFAAWMKCMDDLRRRLGK